MERLAIPWGCLLVHIVSGYVVKYNNTLYVIDKIPGLQWYNDKDYYIHFDNRGIVYEALEYVAHD